MEGKNTYCVYVHTNKLNGKKYVGQTVHGDDPNKRWRNGYGYGSDTYFYRAINKYGWDNFEHEIIDSYLTKIEADTLEQLLIKEFNTKDDNYGYNLTDGGEGVSGYIMPEECRMKISLAHQNQPLSESHKKAISDAHLGKQHTENHSKKISDGHMNSRYKDYESIYNIAQYNQDGSLVDIYESAADASKAIGINLDDIKKCLMGRMDVVDDFVWMFVEKENVPDVINTNPLKRVRKNSKSVYQFDKDYNLLKEWCSMTEAANALKIGKNNIWKCCNHLEGRKMAGGFIWEYANNPSTKQND